jgi:hypothetical protein
VPSAYSVSPLIFIVYCYYLPGKKPVFFPLRISVRRLVAKSPPSPKRLWSVIVNCCEDIPKIQELKVPDPAFR